MSNVTVPAVPPHLELVGPEYIAAVSGPRRGVKRVQNLASESPEYLPPRVKMPGSRAILFRRVDVDEWAAAGFPVRDRADEQPASAPKRKRRGRPRRVGTWHRARSHQRAS